MPKRSVTVENWTVVLRVRVQKKKRKVNGRTRGRYEGKTAHVIVTAPNGERREIYLGSGERLRRDRELAVEQGGGTKGKNECPADNPSRCFTWACPEHGESNRRAQREMVFREGVSAGLRVSRKKR